MKKLILIGLFLAFSASGFSQKLTRYKASNGQTYHLGDTIRISKGSLPNGDFKHLIRGGYYGAKSDYANLTYKSEGKDFIVGKIKVQEDLFEGRTILIHKQGVHRFYLDIEKALEDCEITPCNDQNDKALQDQ